MMEGWKCPVCGRGVAPAVKHCAHGGEGARPITTNPPADCWPPVPLPDTTAVPPGYEHMPWISAGRVNPRSFGVLHGQQSPWKVTY